MRLLERLRTRITLGADGDYQTQKDPVEGTLTATLTFSNHDADLVSRYIRKHRLRPDQKVPYSAGCLVPQGRVGIAELGEDLIVRLDGDVRDIPALRSEDPPASSQRNFSLGYQLSAAPGIDGGPFWITPSIAPESERHVLELDMQWTKFGPDNKEPLELDAIKLLRITVPVRWGRVQGSSHRATSVSSPDSDQGLQTIEWKQLSPDKRQRDERRLTIVVKFENQIVGEDDLSGHLEATMTRALSGVDGVRIYHALGARRAVSGTPSVKTRVEADFTLSLTSIRYQAVRVFPEHADEDSYAADFHAIPGDDTVIALTNALAQNGFYIKRVTENPPRSGGRADVVHRVWDIVGRNYEGVHPVDFHLVLTGEEVHKGDVRPEMGSTKIRIAVRGAYTDDEMRTRIDDKWARLQAVTEETLKGLPPPERGPDED